MNKKWIGTASALMVGGALLAGGLVWAANPHAKTEKHAASPAFKLNVNETPVQRQANIQASFAPIVKMVTPSVVKISTVIRAKTASGQAVPPQFNDPFFRRFFGDQFQGNQPMQTPPEYGVGSGVIVTKDGYILTNNHVVDHADQVTVKLNDGREFTAKVVGRDPKSDIAVVKVDAHNLPAIQIADSDKVQVGDIVLAVGNPFGIGTTVTMGMVSAKGRAPLGLDYQDFIQTDAAINPGNSGGALVDTEGRLIGINTAILSRSGGNQGIGFAIPVNLADQVMTSLVKYGHVVRGFLGVTIQDVTPALAKEFKLKNAHGALVSDVSPNSPASKAGFASGDVITQFDGKNVTDSRHLKLEVAETKPGQKVPVEIMRNGSTRTLEVKVGELPGSEQVMNASHAISNDTGTLNGVGVADLTSQVRHELNVPANIHGAVITSVDQDSASAEAGLKVGDVILEINRHPVKNADEAVRLTEHPKSKVTLVRVWSKGGTHYVVVDESHSKNS